MSNIRILIMSHTGRRFISSSSLYYKNYAGRESKFLSNLISKSEPKRKWYKNNPKCILDNGIDAQKKKLTSLHVQRRLTVLNKLFMKHITDLMSTGGTTPDMLEHQIEVTQVTLSPDFKIANVYWTHEKVNDKNWLTKTEEMLKNYAFSLRHELSQLRVISHVPPIHFVKDKTYSLAKEVEERLATIRHTIQICPPSEIDNRTLKSDVVNDDEILETDDIDIALPQMRHDVLGLDHYRIMSKIKSYQNQSTHKSKNNTIYPTSNSNNMDILVDIKQDELFTQFLKMRQIREKQRSRLKNSKQMEENPMYTDGETFDDDEDLETPFDNTFEYDENTYVNEIYKYD